jgi:hypothetical protein
MTIYIKSKVIMIMKIRAVNAKDNFIISLVITIMRSLAPLGMKGVFGDSRGKNWRFANHTSDLFKF